jgi:hypothetical protein
VLKTFSIIEQVATNLFEKRAVQWAQNVANGKDDRKQSLVDAKFIGGELIPRVK